MVHGMTEWKLQYLKVGWSRGPQGLLIQGAPWTPAVLPSLVGVLVNPSVGVVLFDTGYSERYRQEARRWPHSLRSIVNPAECPSADEAVHQLHRRGINAKDVRCIVLSHFHGAHLGGLKDFPVARYRYTRAAWEAASSLRGFTAMRAGFMPGLLPGDFESRSDPVSDPDLTTLPPDAYPFTRGWVLFEGAPLWLVPLPGHAIGHAGLLVGHTGGVDFLVGDAVWSRRAYQAFDLPPEWSQRSFADPPAYLDTVKMLAELSTRAPDIKILPSHCAESIDLAIAQSEAKRPPRSEGTPPRD